MKMTESRPVIHTMEKVKHKDVIKLFFSWGLMIPGLFFLYFLIWRPNVLGIAYSFCDLQGYNIVGFAGLKNYISVLQDPMFVKTLSNTVMYVVWSFIIGYLPPVVIAIALNEVIRGQNFIKFSLYLPAMIPTVAVSMIWYYMYQPDGNGLLNMLLGVFHYEPNVWLQNSNLSIMLIIVACTWQGMGATVLMYLATLQTVSAELHEAARIEGAGILRRVWHVTIPKILPIMMLMAITQIKGVFQIMIEPLAMTGGGPNNATLSLSLTAYRYAFQTFEVGKSLATGVVTFVLLLFVTIIYQKVDKRIEVD